ncbi:MAG: TonB-dependent receptor [Dysgonamonadaceae bacterium]|nr:TonB-dependent receptor [Dysgonamonadaceae bacterium]
MFAQNPVDTFSVQTLHGVEIFAESVKSFRTTSVSQTVSSENFSTGALTVSDIARQFAGVQVKDYGGVGGMKTVSLRSLGASLTNVTWDGIPVTDCQTGQIDLGRISLTGVEKITLDIGESDNIFQSAQMQSLAGVLNVITRAFPSEKELSASFKAGSFGLVNPSVLFGTKISDRISISGSADYLQSKGNYPYRQTVGNAGYDTVVNRVRQNSAVRNFKAEGNIFGVFDNGGQLSVKIYTYFTDRKLPGPAIYYNDYSKDRLKDKNMFTQANYRQSFLENTDIQANFKFNYAESDYLSVRRYLYFQRELFTDVVIVHRFGKKFSVSWANDGVFGSLNGNIINGIPHRATWFSAVSGKYESREINITAKLLSTRTKTAPKSNMQNLSPYLGFSVKPFHDNSFRLRGFIKNNFRLPTLTDIYYSPAGQRPLKPEKVRQVNLGATFVSHFPKIFPYVFISADIYRNIVSDKLIAYPTNDMLIWTIKNIGRADIRGLDLKGEVNISAGKEFMIKTGGTYTFQRALDVTNSLKENYKKQFPYTPRHSASVWTGVTMPMIDVNYTLIYSGMRYSEASNSPKSNMSPFAEHNVSLSRKFHTKYCSFTVSVECMNVANVQYEVVTSYPMQGRSFMVQLTVFNFLKNSINDV